MGLNFKAGGNSESLDLWSLDFRERERNELRYELHKLTDCRQTVLREGMDALDWT